MSLDLVLNSSMVASCGAQVFAAERQMEERYKNAQAASDEWQRRAEWALRKGDEDLAREALKRRKTFEVRPLLGLKKHQHAGQSMLEQLVCSDSGTSLNFI